MNHKGVTKKQLSICGLEVICRITLHLQNGRKPRKVTSNNGNKN